MRRPEFGEGQDVSKAPGAAHPMPRHVRRDSVSLLPYLDDPARPSIRRWAYAETFSPNGLGPYDRWDQAIRGARIGMVFQEPMTALNPTMTIGNQIGEGRIPHSVAMLYTTYAGMDMGRDNGGVVMITFVPSFLSAGDQATLSQAADHVDHVAALAGADHVGIGSDFDGTVIPNAIGDASGLPRVVEALRSAGYDQPLLEKLAFGNWLRVLELTWRP